MTSQFIYIVSFYCICIFIYRLCGFRVEKVYLLIFGMSACIIILKNSDKISSIEKGATIGENAIVAFCTLVKINISDYYRQVTNNAGV